MINVIISIDYEIFGNGKGDVNEHIIKPMDKILDVCDRHSVKVTIMLEIMEYIAFKKYEKALKGELGYSPADKIERQINRAYSNGHDIQLHIHPQFRNMRYEGAKFILDKGIKPYKELKGDEVEKLLKKCKKTLESIIYEDNYNCRVLRLSNIGWEKVPKNTILPMKNLGFQVHSLSEKIPENEKGYWKIEKGLYEIPIHSNFENFLDFITLRKFFIYLYIWSYYDNNFLSILKGFNNSGHKKSKSDNRSRNLGIKARWDISKQTYKEMMEYLESGKKRYDYHNFEVPLVMIGHTKNFFNKRNLEKFLIKIKSGKIDNIRFSTFDSFIKNDLIHNK